MPSRMVSLAILVLWAAGAMGLFTREILPDFFRGSPPDMRSVAHAEEDAAPVRWDILVNDDSSDGGNLRSVGQARTETRRQAGGGSSLISDVVLDSAGLLRGTPVAGHRGERLAIAGVCEIDPSGNLRTFRTSVRVGDDPEDLIALEGTVRGRSLQVRARGPIPALNWTRSFAYEPLGLVQNAIGPIDRLPGLQVGQTWQTRIVSPLTGRVQEVNVRVERKGAILWGRDLVPALVVLHQMTPFTARTWVRPDGLVLRQEVPFPFAKLILQRAIESPGATMTTDRRGGGTR